MDQKEIEKIIELIRHRKVELKLASYAALAAITLIARMPALYGVRLAAKKRGGMAELAAAQGRASKAQSL